jgi:hypothetical protein
MEGYFSLFHIAKKLKTDLRVSNMYKMTHLKQTSNCNAYFRIDEL